MDNVSLLLLLMSFAVALVVVLAELPTALWALRPPKLKSWFEGEPEAIAPSEQPPAIAKHVEHLLSLGFRPLGYRWERDMYNSVRELAFADSERRTFASLMVVKDKVRMYFLTPFQDGSAVLTGVYARPPLETERLVAIGVEGLPSAALAEHEARIRRWEEAGRPPVERWNREARVAACRAWVENPIQRKLMRAAGLRSWRYIGAAAALLLVVEGIVHVYSRPPPPPEAPPDLSARPLAAP